MHNNDQKVGSNAYLKFIYGVNRVWLVEKLNQSWFRTPQNSCPAQMGIYVTKQTNEFAGGNGAAQIDILIFPFLIEKV